MTLVDIEALLQETDAAAPCGPDLEYDPDFLALEQAILGKPEVQYGDTITAAVPPEWKLVKKLASSLLERSRDLRLAMHLLRANLALHGVAGLADSAALIERLLEERWDSVHPALDADDDMDATLRINSLATLADSATVLRDVKEATLIMLPALGPLSVRMLEVASGELAPPSGQERLATASIEAAFRDVDDAGLRLAAAALGRACASVFHIEEILMHRAGSAQALNLDGLTRALQRGRDFLNAQMVGRGAADPEADPEAEARREQEPGRADGRLQASAVQAAVSGEIVNRADVLRMLDKLIKYYREHEPSSPVPLLLERAKWLAPKSFIEVMEDLAPDGIAQLMVIKGMRTQES
jgi:type VI secretion system protein ImpA